MTAIWRAACIAILFVIAMMSPGMAADNLSTAESNATVQTSPQKTQAVELNKEYFVGYWTDTKNILSAPWRWDSSDWLEASLVLGTGVILYTQDDKIKTWVQKTGNVLLHWWKKEITT